MEKLKNWLISWPVIVIIMILFWPVGCLLLYIRGVTTKGKLKTNILVSIVAALFCYLMLFAGISVTAESGNEELAVHIFLIILFLVGSILTTIYAIKLIKNYYCYKKYTEIIGVRAKVSIDELARQTGDTMETIRKNVTGAIQAKMIDGYMDDDDNVILKLGNEYSNIETIRKVETKSELLTVQCKKCGATNPYLTGKENRCEFCNSILTKQYAER